MELPKFEEQDVEKDLFVNLQAPTELRRHLLECSKSIISIMKNYHKISLMREEKIKLLSMLKVQVNEINLLCNKMKNYVPEYTLSVEKPKPVRGKKLKKEEKRQVGKGKKGMQQISEIDQLQQELNSIEQKLSSLGKN
jgi:hypothetical protein